MSRGDEIFNKEALALKQLRKMDKGELDSTIEINLQSLVDYYYNDIHHKDEREYREQLMNLVVDKKYFLKPVLRIYKDNDDVIPTGLAFMIYDQMNQMREASNREIENLKGSNITNEEITNKTKEIVDLANEATKNVWDTLMILTEKTTKKLKKLGVKEKYGSILAPAMFSADYVSGKNLFRFVSILTNALYKAYKSSLVDEEGVKKSTFGIDITKAKNIGKIMNIITKDMDLGTYGQLILRILLEKRDRSFEQLDSYQLGVYNAISVWALGVLEDKDIFGNKTRQEIIKAFLLQRERDEKRGRDAKRRVEFSDVNEEDYPRISKAFEKVVKK